MSIVEQYVLMNEVGGSMPWSDWRQPQEDLKHAQEAEAKEQAIARREIETSGDTLFALLNHRPLPFDITDECSGVDKAYCNYGVTDLAAEIRAAFVLWKATMDLEQKWKLYRQPNPMMQIILDVDGNLLGQALSLDRISDMTTLDVDVEISIPTAKRLAQYVEQQLGTTEYNKVNIAFKVGR